jgi:hypothetical protein
MSCPAKQYAAGSHRGYRKTQTLFVLGGDFKSARIAKAESARPSPAVGGSSDNDPLPHCFATCWVGDGACYTLKPVPGGFVLVVVGLVICALRSAGFPRFTRGHARLI